MREGTAGPGPDADRGGHRVTEQVDGFALGADDYLPKPFAFAELLARVDALARRTTPAVPPLLRVGEVDIDTARRIGHPGRAAGPADPEGVRRARRAGAGATARWSPRRTSWSGSGTSTPTSFSNAVRVTMVGLRRKLGEPPVIETLRGAGYRLCT